MSDAEAAIIDAFLAAAVDDSEVGALKPKETYQARWPAYAEAIGREYDELVADDAKALAPRYVGHFEIEEELGRGAQGVVYRARDQRLGRTVALKVVHSTHTDSKALLRFRREAQAASRLDDPRIATVFETGTDGGMLFIAMQYVAGETLAARLERDVVRGERPSRAAVREIARLIREVAGAVEHAHGYRILHRDLKPANVMMTPDGEPVILDFGLAGGSEADLPTLSRTGDLFGTPAYLAPELLRSIQARPDARTDVYAIGVCLYEALALQRPFCGTSLAALYQEILGGDAPQVRTHNAAVDADLAVIVETATDPDPMRRYATAAALEQDLTCFLAGEPILARPTPVPRRLRRWIARHPAVATGGLGIAVVVTTALVITTLWLGDSQRQRAKLADALEDARLGRRTRREAKFESLLASGYQSAVGVDSRPARAFFEEALELEPESAEALAGRVFVELPDLAAARLRLAQAPSSVRAHPDIAWLRALLSSLESSAPDTQEPIDRQSVPSSLCHFLEGHIVARGFLRTPEPDAAGRAVKLFRLSVLCAPRPRFHYVHALMMAAARAGDAQALDEAEGAMLRHWSDTQAAWEAIAQFRFSTDPERAEAAAHKMLELGPSAGAHLFLAQLHTKRREPQAARRELDAAVEIDPGLIPARFLRGQAHLAAGRWSEGVADLELVAADSAYRSHGLPLLARALTRATTSEYAVDYLRDLVSRRKELRDALVDPINALPKPWPSVLLPGLR